VIDRPAIDGEDLTGNEGCILACQERDASGMLSGRNSRAKERVIDITAPLLAT